MRREVNTLAHGFMWILLIPEYGWFYHINDDKVIILVQISRTFVSIFHFNGEKRCCGCSRFLALHFIYLGKCVCFILAVLIFSIFIYLLSVFGTWDQNGMLSPLDESFINQLTIYTFIVIYYNAFIWAIISWQKNYFQLCDKMKLKYFIGSELSISSLKNIRQLWEKACKETGKKLQHTHT